MADDSALVAHLERVLDAESVENLWAMHLEKMQGYGFDRLLYGFTRFRTSNGFGDHDDALVLSNHDESYLDEFVRSGLYYHAPMVKWATENEGVGSWRKIAERVAQGGLSPIEQRVIELNLRFGVTAGYSISFRDSWVRSKGAIGLCASRGMSQDEVDAIWAKHGRAITVINKATHLRILTMPFISSRRPLTSRQREALEWVGEGKTTQDIATIMGLTSATVEKHLRLAREALDVETTAQAVLKASLQNQIFVMSA